MRSVNILCAVVTVCTITALRTHNNASRKAALFMHRLRKCRSLWTAAAGELISNYVCLMQKHKTVD